MVLAGGALAQVGWRAAGGEETQLEVRQAEAELL
jgi:hypothetical protein